LLDVLVCSIAVYFNNFFYLIIFLRYVTYGGPYLQTQQTTPKTQHSASETQHNAPETRHNIFETQHKIIETQHKIIETQHEIIKTQHKIIETTQNHRNTTRNYQNTTKNHRNTIINAEPMRDHTTRNPIISQPRTRHAPNSIPPPVLASCGSEE